MHKYSSNENVYTSIIDEKQNSIVTDIQPLLMKFDQYYRFCVLLKDVDESTSMYENNHITHSEVSKELNLINVNNLFIFNSNEFSQSNDVYSFFE